MVDTKAGRRLSEWNRGRGGGYISDEEIEAIERQAKQAARRDIATLRQQGKEELVAELKARFDKADREKDPNLHYYAEAYLLAKGIVEGR